MLASEYINRVVRPQQEFEDLQMHPPQDRMSSNYYNIIRKAKRVYIKTTEGIIAKLKTRSRRALEKNI